MTECQGEKLEVVKKNTKIKNFQGVKRKEKTGGAIEKVSMHRRSEPFLSCGGELTYSQTRCHHPVRLRLPPLRRRGISWYRTHTTTPSGCACHPSTGGELTILRHDATTPSGCACHPSTGGELAGTEPTQPPRQAELNTPPQEGISGAVLFQQPHTGAIVPYLLKNTPC